METGTYIRHRKQTGPLYRIIKIFEDGTLLVTTIWHKKWGLFINGMGDSRSLSRPHEFRIVPEYELGGFK